MAWLGAAVISVRLTLSEGCSHAVHRIWTIRRRCPQISLPAFLEIEPGRYKPVETCSREEIEAKIMSLTMQAQALLDEAKVLGRFLDGTE